MDLKPERTTKAWRVVSSDGFDSLNLFDEPIPEVGDKDVLVELRGASLNFRDIIIPLGQYPFNQKANVVPGSDGAGVVLDVGKNVTRWKPGDKVITMLNQLHISGSVDARIMESGLGGSLDGTFRTIGAFSEDGLVKMPNGLNFLEAATLSCAGVTAWNALFGQPGREPKPGQWVLTQGAGSVSVFALQFAKLIGARVISITSSDKKAEMLTKLGADHIINYRETADWGTKAKALTGGTGVDLVVEVVGAATLAQSVESLKLDGTMSVVGFAGGDGASSTVPSLLDVWLKHFTARGISVGSRAQMEDMVRAIEANIDQLRPVIDPKVFKLADLKEAYEYLHAGANFGKVCIDVGP